MDNLTGKCSVDRLETMWVAGKDCLMVAWMEFESGLFLDAQMVRMLIGISLGASEGDECGIRKGCCDGHPDGVISGDEVGREDGPKLGLFDGLLVGLKL
eukprot:gene46980-60696_t